MKELDILVDMFLCYNNLPEKEVEKAYRLKAKTEQQIQQLQKELDDTKFHAKCVFESEQQLIKENKQLKEDYEHLVYTCDEYIKQNKLLKAKMENKK